MLCVIGFFGAVVRGELMGDRDVFADEALQLFLERMFRTPAPLAGRLQSLALISLQQIHHALSVSTVDAGAVLVAVPHAHAGGSYAACPTSDRISSTDSSVIGFGAVSFLGRPRRTAGTTGASETISCKIVISVSSSLASVSRRTPTGLPTAEMKSALLKTSSGRFGMSMVRRRVSIGVLW